MLRRIFFRRIAGAVGALATLCRLGVSPASPVIEDSLGDWDDDLWLPTLHFTNQECAQCGLIWPVIAPPPREWACPRCARKYYATEAG